MTNESYNGWTNYETWLVNLWIDNEPYWNECARNLAVDESEASELALLLKDMIEASGEQSGQLPETGLFADLINGALNVTNWREIASHLINEVRGA